MSSRLQDFLKSLSLNDSQADGKFPTWPMLVVKVM